MRLIKANWPAPTWIHAVCTTRLGGVSTKPYDSFNLADHVGDQRTHVELHRLHLQQHFNFKTQPEWLNQTHSVQVINLSQTMHRNADGAYTDQTNQICSVLTGDCLPVLICNQIGTVVAAIHCGWRGLCNGILENAILQMQSQYPGDFMAWFGPAIGPRVYEVGIEVRDAFAARDVRALKAFVPTVPRKYLADLFLLAKLRLNQLGIYQIYGGEYCTLTQTDLFFSNRQQNPTGRMASLIWIGDQLGV